MDNPDHLNGFEETLGFLYVIADPSALHPSARRLNTLHAQGEDVAGSVLVAVHIQTAMRTDMPADREVLGHKQSAL